MGRIYEALWGRAFAALYDRELKATEEGGLRCMRRELLGKAESKTLEIGAGTGINLDLYPKHLQELVLTEPDQHMVKRLRRRLARSARSATVVKASAEHLPFSNDSFDTVIATLVLCSVADPGESLIEVARVLKPGGHFLFLEHVRDEDPRLARWQDRLEKPWRFLGDGCRCNRDTVATLRASPLSVELMERQRMPKAPPIVRPLVRGSAVLRT